LNIINKLERISRVEPVRVASIKGEDEIALLKDMSIWKV
jgi:hypothetical protein